MRKSILCLLCIICLLFSGCSMSMSVEEFLRPPKLSDEHNEIYKAITNSLGKNVKLKYPKSGDYRSAFVLHDIDGEEGDEALVFYESRDIRSGESALRMKLLDKSSGSWEITYDLACPGSEIDSVMFADLGGGRTSSEGAAVPNIILNYTLMNQTEKAFSVLKYIDKKPVELLASSYNAMTISDLNGDGLNELVTVSVNKELQVASASMYTDNGTGLELLSNTPLYGGPAEYLRVTEGKLDENTPALFLDYSKGGGQSGTDVLYCYGSRLFCPDSIGENPQLSIISRQINDYMAEIYSYDIDGDGFVEIPSTVPLPGYETLTKPEQLCAVMWYTVENDNFTAESYSYFSGRYRFALIFPNRWTGVVTAYPDFTSNEIVFVVYDPERTQQTDGSDEIMRIRVVDKDNAEAVAAAKSLKQIGESEEALFFCSQNDKSDKAKSLALTESELKSGFVVLN